MLTVLLGLKLYFNFRCVLGEFNFLNQTKKAGFNKQSCGINENVVGEITHGVK